MAKTLQLRRGTTLQHGSFTGQNGEATIDTDKKTIVVHDGVTLGGYPLVKESLLGTALGVATLGADGKVPTAQLPSYVDDVLEYANLGAFPVTGEVGKIYVALDLNDVYRWGGSSYIKISDAVSTSDTSLSWATARTVTFATGDVTGSFSIKGDTDVSNVVLTIAPNSVALGTDTTGNFVSALTSGSGITITGTAGEAWNPTVSLSATIDLGLITDAIS